MRAALVGWLALGGCLTSRQAALMPAPGYGTVAGSSLAAEGRDGVTVYADGNAWRGWPQNLATVLTPVWVSIQNTSHRPVRIQHDEFTLYGQSGAATKAMGPYAEQTPGPRQTRMVPNPGNFDGFYVADYLAPYYPWLPVWGEPLDSGPSYYPVTWRPHLPTASMIDRALPEGVLQPGGHASGFLYFPKLGSHERAVTFRADLHEPQARKRPPQRLAIIDINFRVIR